MKRNGFFFSLLFVLFFNSCFIFITTCYEQIGPLKQNISHLPLQVKTFFISCKCSCQPAFMRHKLQEKNGNLPNQSSLKAIEQIGYSNTYMPPGLIVDKHSRSYLNNFEGIGLHVFFFFACIHFGSFMRFLDNAKCTDFAHIWMSRKSLRYTSL